MTGNLHVDDLLTIFSMVSGVSEHQKPMLPLLFRKPTDVQAGESSCLLCCCC